MAFHTCNLKRSIGVRFILALMLCATASSAFAQALPWQTQQPQAQAPRYPAQNPPQPSHHYHPSAASQPSPAGNVNAAREEDDRQLNLLATKFYGITAKDPEVIPKLKRLQGQVHRYRNDLANRDYDATDIKNDARKLEGRIAHQRKELEAKAEAAAAQPPAAPVQPAPPAAAAVPSLSPVAPLSSPGAGAPVAVR